jgi:uncharacterized repeat protein (TIGR01451 family)
MVIALLAATLGLGGCADREAPSGTTTAPTPGGIGTPDRPSSGAITVDEAALRGSIEKGQLTVKLVARPTGGAAATGTLSVALRSVDDQTAFGTATVDYAVAAGGTQELSAQITLPAGLTQQSDWVKFNVRVDDGTTSGLRVTRSLQQVLPAYEVAIEGPSQLVVGKTASYRARARDPFTKKPRAGMPLTLTVSKNDALVGSYDGVTAATGDVVFELSLPTDGSYQIGVATAAQGTRAEVTGSFAIKLPGSKVLLTTDKPLYQPGQTIHLRALALSEQGNTPVAGGQATFEVEDGKGNKIFKRAITTDDHGIAAADFAIGPVVNLGDFKVRAIVGEQKTEKTVNVSHYALPKFKVAVQTDKGWYKAGETVLVAVDAGYFFGKPVAGGSLTVEASTLDVGQTVFQTVQGKTDASGKYSFSLKLPASLVGLPLDGGKALVNLKIKVADAATQEVTQEKLLTVSQSGVDIALVPESTALVPGVENHLDLFASDPLGAPLLGAQVTLALPDGSALAGQTDDHGHAGFAWTPAGPDATVIGATVTPVGGAAASTQFTFGTQAGASHVVVRTDKAVYATGEQVHVDVACSDPSATVYVDWINAGQTVDMRTLPIKDGAASFTMPIDAGLLGSNRVEAYIVGDDGGIIRAGRTIFARGQGSLAVDLATDKPQYEPGQPAKLTFSVKDEAGNPQVAALGVQVVDEAVFGLIDARPGLLRTYFELESDYSQPAYEIHGPSASFDDLLFGATSNPDPAAAQAAQTRASAAFAALGDKVPTGLSAASWPAVATTSQSNLQPYLAAEKKRLTPSVTAAVAAAKAQLDALGCKAEQYYCNDLSMDYSSALSSRARTQLSAWDFWGNPYTTSSSGYGSPLRFQSSGPDEKAGTSDDVAIDFTYTDLGLPQLAYPTTGEEGDFGGGGAAGATAGGVDNGGQPPTDPSKTATTPRVRKDFPETLYVNPSIITGPDGTATVEIPMADSITTWRVSTLANSAGGKLGGGQGGIKVFQDFFADISFPATLTRGDEVTFPVAVYNYLDTAQTVQLVLAPGDWYTALGPTQLSVDLGPGEVKGVSVPVRVEKVGVQTLTVKAIGTTKSDAVARMVSVIPDGKEIAKATSGALGAGQISLGASFPAGAVAGSPSLHLDVYPAFLSQVVSGMDSILQTPNGCFEQTTSTTWPNVLVTRYMKQTNQLTPAIQLKADSLISAGYQRLLTFEHPGGGFSWFGTQDPKPFLSVTAFGIMEFADMAQVRDVDSAMLDRTIQWMLGQQQPDGSWTGDQSEFFSFQTSAVRNTAFVAWALSSAGTGGGSVQSALSYVKSHLEDKPDSYTLGLVANAFVAGAPADSYTQQLIDRLEASKTEAGDKISWSAAGTETTFYGQGQDADVTSTALSTHALIAAGGHATTVNGALQFLASARDEQGNFGSTQATIWTLRTLLLAASKGTEGAVGTLDVAVDGASFSTVLLTADQSDVMHTVDLSSLATTGDHQVELSFVGTGKISYNLVAKHNLPWKDTGEEAPGPLSIGLAYDKHELAVNDTVKATVTVTNNTASDANMVMVTLGIPPGFELVPEDLDAYLTAGTLSRYEATGKQLDLYITRIAASKQQAYNYRLRATMPVKAEDGGAKVYPYYQPDKKSSAASTQFVVSTL